MYSPSLFVCRQRALMSSALRPLVDLRLELVQAHAAVDGRIAPRERVEVDAVQDEDLHQ